MTGKPSSTGVYEAPFGDAIHTFRLDLAGLRELQDKTDCGPAFLLSRIVSGQWRVDDLRETLRIGLVRGGLEPVKALVLMERYFDPGPYGVHMGLAALVLQAAIFEPEELEIPGKKRRPNRSRTAASGSASSSETAPPSDSLRNRPDA